MTYGIKNSILNLEKNSYAKENSLTEDLSNFIDCSAGINPLGFSKSVEKAIKDIPLELINLYPETSNDLKDSIIEYWKDLNHIARNQILFGDGSIELIYKINKMFIDIDSKVLGYSPQFSDYINDIKTYGGIYEYYLMDNKNNFKFNVKTFLEKMNKNHKLFYIDNPNNPTGQVIDIEDLEKITIKAKQLGAPVIIDEAYGDFMNIENSAVSLINKHDNLFILRTFSKGLGLAGIRAAYIITSTMFAKHYLKISNPYEMGSISRYLAELAIKDKSFMGESIRKLSVDKKNFMDSLTKLKILESNLSVPIMTIMHPDPNVDLENVLLEHKIISVSGRAFIGLGKNFARIRLSKDIDKMIRAFQQVEDEIYLK